MSTDLHWRPAVPPPPSHQLPYALKRALAARIWGHDGSLRGVEIEFGKDRIPYLEGLADAGVDGAQELADILAKHGAVILWIE